MDREQDRPPDEPVEAERASPPTTAAEERGERVSAGREIARGGKDKGHVPGATGDVPEDPRSGQRPADSARR